MAGKGKPLMDHRFYNDVLELLSDIWLHGGQFFDLIHEKYPGVSRQTVRSGVNGILAKMEANGTVECKCEENWRVGYKWRLKMK